MKKGLNICLCGARTQEPVPKGVAIYSFRTHLPWYMSHEELFDMSTAFSADVKLTASVLR